MLTNGVSCNFKPLDEKKYLNDLNKAIKRGNHKSASSKKGLLESLVQSDIKAGFQVPMPKNLVKNVKGAVVVPYGIPNQFTINELGERIGNDRLIHDQSFDYSEGNSVNHRLTLDGFHELRCSSCLLQIIHYAHALRLARPKIQIVASKVDLKSACRRGHLCGLLAALAVTIV